LKNHHASDAVVNKPRFVKTDRYNSAFVAYLYRVSSVFLLMFSVPYEFTEFSYLINKLQIEYHTCILLLYAETPPIAHCAGLTLEFCRLRNRVNSCCPIILPRLPVRFIFFFYPENGEFLRNGGKFSSRWTALDPRRQPFSVKWLACGLDGNFTRNVSKCVKLDGVRSQTAIVFGAAIELWARR